MLLEYQNADFWPAFHQSHWQPEIPTVLRAPFRQFPFSEDSVLRALKFFNDHLQKGDTAFRHVLSPEFSLAQTKKIFKAAFRQPVFSMQELGEKMCQAMGKPRMGLMVNNLQSLDPHLWEGAARFLQDAHPWVDFPMGRCIIDLFFGNYSKSFLGLHKDMQEILGFVVSGEKTVYAWPFEYFLSKVPKLSQADRYFQMPLQVDYRRYVKDAIVLKARAGDVIYWPSPYWHTAEGTSKQAFSVFLSLGFFHAAPSSAEATRSLLQFREQIRLPPQGSSPAQQSLYSQEVEAKSHWEETAQRLRWATAYAFPFGAPKPKKLFLKKSPKPQTFFKKASVLLLWSEFPKDKKILISASGHWILLNASPRLRELLDKLCSGQPIEWSFTGAKHRIPVLCSYRNKNGEQESRKFWSQYGEEAALIFWLEKGSCLEMTGAAHKS